MSSSSSTSTAALAPAADDWVVAGPLGLARATWVKLGVLGGLMLALFWVNLARLWAKTNPFTGQGNWEHAIFIPLVGLYYLYVWRDQLLGENEPATKRPAAPTAAAGGGGLGAAGPWSLPGVWLLILAVPVLVATASAPVLAVGGGTGGIRDLLGSLADRGIVKLVPYAFGVVAVAAAAAGFVYVKRDELRYPSTQAWLATVWGGLGAWLLSMCVVWGVLFFVQVLAPSRADAVVATLRYAAAAVGLAGLAHVAGRGGSLAWRARYAAILGGSSGWFGAFVMVWGILFSFWGIWPGQNDFFKDVGMVVALFGVVTLVGGWRVMAVAWFPVVFLFVALPWPDQVYSWVALPLQNFAAKVGVFVLGVTGVDANQFGTKIVMVGNAGQVRTLNVAEACAGLKSLMTFVFVASAVAFLSPRLLWQKLLIVASAVPIAILCNATRVAGQGLLDFYVSRQWSENFAHGFAGLVMLIPGFFMILAVCWVLDHLFVEEADDRPARPVAVPPKATVTVARSPSVASSPPAARPFAAAAVPAAPRAAAVTAPARAVLTIPRKAAPPAAASRAPAAAAVAPARPAVVRPAGQPVTATKPVAPTPRPAAVAGAGKPVSRPTVAPAAQRTPAPPVRKTPEAKQ